MKRLLNRFRCERGMTLVITLGILSVLSISVGTAIYYTTTNAQSAHRSKAHQIALSLAEAGLNNAMAVLSKTTNNALDPTMLPATTTYYEQGRVVWSGTLDRAAAVWSVTSTGYERNPTGPNLPDIRRTITAKISVVPTVTQPANSPAWNYIYARDTGNTCDMTIANNVSGSSRLYVAGNLCLLQNAGLTQTGVIVQGNLDLENNAQVGVNTNMSTRAEVEVTGQCVYGTTGSWGACGGNQDARRIYSKKDGPNYVVGVKSPASIVGLPTADFDTWYTDAIPGPSQTCTTQSGTPPTFDNDATRNNSVATVFELTAASSYTCRVGQAATPSGEISWDASTRVLTVSGTIYIDGSVKMTNGQLNSYNGQATIYVSGTLYMGNGTKLCGGVSGSDCDFAAWNPNAEMLSFVAEGSGGLAGTGNSITIDQNGQIQGSLYAIQNVQFLNNSRSDGPIIGNTVFLLNNVQNDQFPTITTVPVGMPGSPIVYAQPNPPSLFSG
jgi:Tfp pilus assembly protein PilX